MSNFGEKIALLTDPTPQLLDPEDSVNFDSSEKVYSQTSDGEFEKDVSDLRRKTAPLLEDIDPAYAGRKVSRRDLGHIFNKDEKSDFSANISENSDNFSDESDGGYLSESEVLKFQNLVSKTKKDTEEESENEIESVDQEDSEIEDESDNDEEDEDNDEMTNRFSNIDVTSDIERGKAVKNQLEIWNRLMEVRIKLQKLLVIANKHPQFRSWKSLKISGGKEFIDTSQAGSRSLQNLLGSLKDLQTELDNRSPDVKNFNPDVVENGKTQIDSDEEIPSDTDSEKEKAEQPQTEKKKGHKRKHTDEETESFLEKRFKSLVPYRNMVIQKWDEKTRLSSGKMNQKSFAAFDNSALKQIEQNLQDKSRLIRRTQLKRSLYRVIGKPAIEENLEDNEVSVSKQDMLLKDYDPEIFDDDDFYRQLLKDVIESKSFGIDPAVLRKQMEIQKIRNKMKRKVDTKASKGRKLRYDVHPKLVNFMAPVQICQMSDEARRSFLKYLFPV